MTRSHGHRFVPGTLPKRKLDEPRIWGVQVRMPCIFMQDGEDKDPAVERSWLTVI